MSRTYHNKFAFIKPSLDVHTMGVNSISGLLRDCGYEVIIGDTSMENAINDIRYEVNQKKLVHWIKMNNINNLGISYRLDEDLAVTIMGYINNITHYCYCQVLI